MMQALLGNNYFVAGAVIGYSMIVACLTLFLFSAIRAFKHPLDGDWLVLTAYQIRQLHGFVQGEPGHHEVEVTWLDAGLQGTTYIGAYTPEGLHVFNADHPDEGSMYLPETDEDDECLAHMQQGVQA